MIKKQNLAVKLGNDMFKSRLDELEIQMQKIQGNQNYSNPEHIVIEQILKFKMYENRK